MAEPEQVIEERERLVAALAVLAHARRPVALGERRPVRTHEERHVPVGGRLEAEGLEDQQLPRRVGEVILAAQRQRHSHAGIVHRVGEEERGRAVRTPHHEIADIIGREALRPVHEVNPLDAHGRGHAEAQRRREALRLAPGALIQGQVAAGAGIARRLPGAELCAARELELERRAEAGVDGAPLLELREVAGIESAALRLAIRAERILAIGPGIPLDAEPPEVLKQRVHMGLEAALGVGILDAQDEAPACLSREQQVEERGARIPEVQLAGGAGSETGDRRRAHRAHVTGKGRNATKTRHARARRKHRCRGRAPQLRIRRRAA